MVEIPLESLLSDVPEGTIQEWFLEEGDPIQAGDDLVEIITEDGNVGLKAPVSGILAEVNYDEGEVVQKDDVICHIDDEAEPEEDIPEE